jgi:hypothetical protein
MGLPDALLERARALAGSSSVGLESVIARLQAREATLVKESERLAAAEAAAAATAEAQREAAAALARRERELGLKAREAVEAAIAETRAALVADRARRAAGGDLAGGRGGARGGGSRRRRGAREVARAREGPPRPCSSWWPARASSSND